MPSFKYHELPCPDCGGCDYYCAECHNRNMVDLEDFVLLPGEMKATLSGEAVHKLAALLAYWFEQQGGENYVELELHQRLEDGGERFIFTMQKASGKTPHQLLEEAKEALQVADNYIITLRQRLYAGDYIVRDRAGAHEADEATAWTKVRHIFVTEG